MDKSTFDRLIQTSSNITSNEAVLLEELVEAFPYCQTAHLLLAKESKQKKSMNYPKKLKKASTYLLDRTILHKAIYSVTNTETVSVQNVLTTELAVEPTKSSILEEIEQTIKSTKENRKQLDSLLSDIPQKTIEKAPFPLIDDAIGSNFFKTESRLGDELILSSKEKEPESSNNVELFLAYLNQNPQFNEKKKPQDPGSKIQDEVINRFLEKEPKITRQIPNTVVSENPNDLSKKSTELKNELITENFALILVKQNKIEKAKEVYKKLMLKYPDKSAYFGAKLNELENK